MMHTCTRGALNTPDMVTDHGCEGCLHLKQPELSEVCQRARERTTAEINWVKRSFPPPSPHTQKRNPEPWPLKEGDRWVLFFGQVLTNSCPEHRELRWGVCVCVSEMGVPGDSQRSNIPWKKELRRTQIYTDIPKAHTCRHLAAHA